MSSPYPILDNRSIDKWKVTELREELKRRKLTTRGLKEDLIKRLGEALLIERENAKNGDSTSEEGYSNAETTPLAMEAAPLSGKTTLVVGEATLVVGEAMSVVGKAMPVASEKIPIDLGIRVSNENLPVSVEDTPVSAETTSFTQEEAPVALETIPVGAKTHDDLIKHGGNKDEKVDGVRNQGDVNDPSVDLDQQTLQEDFVRGEAVTDSVFKERNKDAETHSDNEDFKLQPENECFKAQQIDGLHEVSAPNGQVSTEISPVSGFEVKFDCISTGSVSNNENVELKDNIIADNVKLEHNVVKSEEMLEPSSVGGESHPMDVEVPHGKKASVGDRDDNNAANADMTKGNDNADTGDSEKLNLDRSSGDDSMEEDVDIKQADSNNSDELGNKSEKNEVPGVKVEKPVDVVRNDPVSEKGHLDDNEKYPAVASEKRKLLVNDHEAAGNVEPVKRQRRWNNEDKKVPEAKASGSTPTVTPKPMGLNRNFSRSDSSASEDGPKERIVPPSQKDPTNSLRIDCFLRPFTLKAVQELLGKTGTVTSFWMDHIKTHCYVTYSSVEGAIETRNAVFNLQWPPNGGRLLVAEFVDSEEVKTKLEASPAPTAPAAPPSQPKPPSWPEGSRQQPPQTALPPPPPLSNPPPIRERLPPPPPVMEKQEPPILTLDDLFRKTKATPRIYYLPLSEEQVAMKLAAWGKSRK